jgi:hypothetical protein
MGFFIFISIDRNENSMRVKKEYEYFNIKMIQRFIYKFFFVSVLCLFSCNIVKSQQNENYTILGIITNSIGNPIEFATITVLLEKDSTQITGVIANERGEFSIKALPQGNYIFVLTHILYEMEMIDVRLSGDLKMNTIIMTESDRNLMEITVTPNFIQHQLGRYIVSLQGNPITKGNTTDKLIELLPGVSKQGDSFTMNGREVSNIYIDERKIHDKNELEVLQAEYIDKVEIIYTTENEYNVANTGGIIKIKLKKLDDKGYYGSLSGELTINPSYGLTNDNINSIINYRYGKFSIYNYLSYNDFNKISDYNITNYYLDFLQSISLVTQGREWNHKFADNLSIFYDLTKKHSIGGNLRINVSNAFPDESSVSNLFNPDKTTESSNSQINGKTNNKEYQTAFNYNWKINSKGSNFKFIADYLRYEKTDWRDYKYIFHSNVPHSELKQTNRSQITDMFDADAKLAIVIGEKYHLNFGGKYNLDRTKRLLDYHDWNNNSWIVNEDLCDDFKLSGNEYAAYITFSSNIGNLMYKVGLREQVSNIRYNSFKIAKEHSKTYSGLYPSVSLNYKIDTEQGHEINLSYQKEIDPIPYSAISPVIIYNNEYSYTKGNFDLRPPVFNVLEAILIIKNKWNINALFINSKNIIHYSTLSDEINPLISYTMPVNGEQLSVYCLGIDRTFKITKWWNCKMNVNAEWRKYTENSSISLHKTDAIKGYFTINNNFQLDHGWGGNLTWSGEPLSYKYFERTYKSVHSLYGKIYKYLWNNKLLIDLNFVAYTKNRIVVTERENFKSNRKYMTHPEYFSVGITYNFKHGEKVNVNQSQKIQQYREIKDN